MNLYPSRQKPIIMRTCSVFTNFKIKELLLPFVNLIWDLRPNFPGWTKSDIKEPKVFSILFNQIKMKQVIRRNLKTRFESMMIKELTTLIKFGFI